MNSEGMRRDGSRIPTSLITGFLGSGKTTLLNYLVQQPEFGDALVIINEFGEIGIDHLIVATPSDRVRLLANGCLCCEVKGELVETLREAIAQRQAGTITNFNRIVIETTGLADPAPVVRSLVEDEVLSGHLELDAVVCVVDCGNVQSQVENQDEVPRQIAMADFVLLSKTDLVSESTQSAVRQLVAQVNPFARIDRVAHGHVNLGVLCGAVGWAPLTRVRNASVRKLGAKRTAHSTGLKTFSLIHEGTITEGDFAAWLAILLGLRGARLLRVKGIVNVDGNPMVVHAVQSVLHEVERLKSWPSSDKRTRLVFIVRELERDAVQASFLAAIGTEKSRGEGIDPDQYRRFVAAAASLQ